MLVGLTCGDVSIVLIQADQVKKEETIDYEDTYYYGLV